MIDCTYSSTVHCVDANNKRRFEPPPSITPSHTLTPPPPVFTKQITVIDPLSLSARLMAHIARQSALTIPPQ
jgi:hypothetical protein